MLFDYGGAVRSELNRLYLTGMLAVLPLHHHRIRFIVIKTEYIYPQATSYNREKTSYPNLCYGNIVVKDFDEATNAFAAGVSVKGLYETYYKNMIEMLKLNPRLRTAYIDLKITDIISLDFSKLIYIDGVYWRINRIVDYQPNKNISTQVELVEWVDVGTIAAKEGFQT